MLHRQDGKPTSAQMLADLEPYRRLVELQKQMIELAQQYECSRRECEALRAEVAREIAKYRRRRPGLNHRLRAAVLRLGRFNQKGSLPC